MVVVGRSLIDGPAGFGFGSGSCFCSSAISCSLFCDVRIASLRCLRWIRLHFRRRRRLHRRRCFRRTLLTHWIGYLRKYELGSIRHDASIFGQDQFASTSTKAGIAPRPAAAAGASQFHEIRPRNRVAAHAAPAGRQRMG